MIQLGWRFIVLIVGVISSLTVMWFPNTSVAANFGITVNGALLVAEVSPGTTLNHKITITVGTNDPPTDVVVQIGGIGQLADGTYVVLDGMADISCYSARQFISVDHELLHLEPGIPGEVIATIKIPEDIGDGGRYAIINIATQPVNENGIGVISAVNVPIYLTVKNSKLIHEGKITAISTSEPNTGDPIDIFTSFQNTGNHHFKVKGEVTISDSNGEKLDTLYTILSSTSIIPTSLRQYRTIFIPDRELPPGLYFIKSRIILENNIILDEVTSSFEMKAPYIPPSSPATQTVIPTSSALLETADSSISLNFPKGAVTSSVDVILRDYPSSQLPPLPSGYQVTNICFRVDGINGLLAEKATVTVKFTASELEKAEANYDRLKLAYWDEVTGKWSILNTKIDKTQMMLSTATNHFSIWTVMVSPAPKIKMLVVIGSVTVIAAIPILSIIFLTKKKGHRVN